MEDQLPDGQTLGLRVRRVLVPPSPLSAAPGGRGGPALALAGPSVLCVWFAHSTLFDRGPLWLHCDLPACDLPVFLMAGCFLLICKTFPPFCVVINTHELSCLFKYTVQRR